MDSGQLMSRRFVSAAAIIITFILLANMCRTGLRQTGRTGTERVGDQVGSVSAKGIDEETAENEDDVPYFALTDAERDLVERVVMAEAGGEGLTGQKLVAQCILNACIKDGVRPGEAVVKNRYSKRRPHPSKSVGKAVSAVFDKGEKVIDEQILYFYAPAMSVSSWHESQKFVLEYKGHRFFAPSR